VKKFLLTGIILLLCISGIMVNLIECSSSTSIHTGKISGVIKASWPGVGFEPSAARIDILNTGLFTISSSYGNYILNNVPAGQHTITVFKQSDIAKPAPITPEKINNSWKLFSDEISTGLVI